jgi:hypothetical protein
VATDSGDENTTAYNTELQTRAKPARESPDRATGDAHGRHLFDFFVSCARGDRYWAEPVVAALKRRGLRGFSDIQIRPGDESGPALAEALSHSRNAIIFVSESSASSDQVTLEGRFAASQARIIPIVREGDLSALRGGLAGYQAAIVPRNLAGPVAEAAFDQLADVIRGGQPSARLGVVVGFLPSTLSAARSLLHEPQRINYRGLTAYLGGHQDTAWRILVVQAELQASAPELTQIIGSIEPDVVFVLTLGAGLAGRARPGEVILASAVFTTGGRPAEVHLDPGLTAVARDVAAASDRVAVAPVISGPLPPDGGVEASLSLPYDVVAAVDGAALRVIQATAQPAIMVIGIEDVPGDSAELRIEVASSAGDVIRQMLRTLADIGEAAPLSALVGVGIVGFGDQPAEADLLGRSPIIATVKQLLAPQRSGVGAKGIEDAGPTLVSLEGPWGAGKTTFLRLLRAAVDSMSPVERPQSSVRRLWPPRLSPLRSDRLTVRAASRRLGHTTNPEQRCSFIERTEAPTPITVWFNPWTHQSSDQIWSGLSREVAKSVVDGLCRTSGERARYWFNHNAERLDGRRLQRELHRRIASPLFRISLFALVIPLLAQLVKAPEKFDIPDLMPAVGNDVRPMAVVAGLPLLMILAGMLHTAWRYLFAPAANFLPPELFVESVLTGSLWDGQPSDPVMVDPLRRARSGRLYLLQHGIHDILKDAADANRYLVTLIDDLDRCTPRATAEVFEAINLFLSGEFPRARFVLAVDPSVVAAHLNVVYADLGKSTAASGDDPDVGWAFLRKLVQLPVILPLPRSGSDLDPLEDLLGPTQPVHPAPADQAAPDAGRATPSPPPLRPPGNGAVAELTTPPIVNEVDERQQDLRITKLECDERFRRLLTDRLDARPGCSLREIKRLLTLWQFYVRVLDRTSQAIGADAVSRACHLLLLAEIVTRWPAIQSRLHRSIDGRRGLDILAAAAHDDIQWGRSIAKLHLNTAQDASACRALRRVLNEHEGPAVAELAGRLL